MNMTLKTLHLQDFKGVKNSTIEFDGNTIIRGKNGTGKTTIADAYFFLFQNCDSALHNNPNIRPIDIDESTPRVEAIIDIDGKTINLAKQQKRTVSKPNADGISKISLTNTYEVNSVPKSERDFKQYLTDLGFDFENMLPLSHADVFTAQKTADMRKMLFNMTDDLSDSDIAKQMGDDVKELSELLTNYTVDEVTAMQKATLKKIAEDYGKDGEIIRAKIEALEHERVDIDLSALELLKADTERKLSDIKLKLEEAARIDKAISEINTQIMQVKFNQGDYLRQFESEKRMRVSELSNQLPEIKAEITRLNLTKETHLNRISDYTNNIPRLEAKIKSLEAERNTLSEAVYDEEKAICPTCKRKYPVSKIDALRAEYGKQKAERVEEYNVEIQKVLASLEASDKAIADCKEKVIAIEKAVSENTEKEKRISASIAEIESADSVPAQETEGYKAFDLKVSDLQAQIDAMTLDYSPALLKVEADELNNALKDIEREIGKSAINEQIDEHISELRNKQITYEQNKADAEKVLYEISLLSRRKNELLTDSINSHFKAVKWVLFRYAKNGNYEDCCVATIDGKELGVSTNNALGIKAKVDICEGLQNFYGQHYPILLDNVEAIDTEGRKALVTESQLVMFAVTDTPLQIGGME